MENIQVALRVRPLNEREISKGEQNIWQIEYDSMFSLDPINSREIIAQKKILGNSKTSFTFDQCFSDMDNNVKVYETVVKPLSMSSLDGINGTLFMYGQTGAGKTYTMMGNEELYERRSQVSDNLNKYGWDNRRTQFNPSVLILALTDIFEAIKKDNDKNYMLKCSYIEIYNDQIHDLLKPKERMNETLTVNEDKAKGFYVKGVSEISVSTIDEILDKLKKGEENRHYAQTLLNHCSSRSHTIFRLIIQSVTSNTIRQYLRENGTETNNINTAKQTDIKSEDDDTIVSESYLNFVDLAGSERVSNHHALLEDSNSAYYEEQEKIKERVNEGKHINKSLFFLTQVISLKSEGKSNQHIPYRNSPLTKILRSSLGGNSRTLVILCVNPATSQLEHTLSTLRFGANAKKIENKVEANVVTKNNAEAIKILLQQYEKKIRDLENDRYEERRKNIELQRALQELQEQKTSTAPFQCTCKTGKRDFGWTGSRNNCLSTEMLVKCSRCKRLTEGFISTNSGILFLTQGNEKLRIDALLEERPLLRQNWQELVYDAQGEFAVLACKRLEEENKTLRERINTLLYGVENIEKDFYNTWGGLISRRDENQKLKINIDRLLKECIRNWLEKERSFRTITLYEKRIGIEKQPDTGLENLEKMFYGGIKDIIEEKTKRSIIPVSKRNNEKLGNRYNNGDEDDEERKTNEGPEEYEARKYKKNLRKDYVDIVLDDKGVENEPDYPVVKEKWDNLKKFGDCEDIPKRTFAIEPIDKNELLQKIFDNPSAQVLLTQEDEKIVVEEDLSIIFSRDDAKEGLNTNELDTSLQINEQEQFTPLATDRTDYTKQSNKSARPSISVLPKPDEIDIDSRPIDHKLVNPKAFSRNSVGSKAGKSSSSKKSDSKNKNLNEIEPQAKKRSSKPSSLKKQGVPKLNLEEEIKGVVLKYSSSSKNGGGKKSSISSNVCSPYNELPVRCFDLSETLNFSSVMGISEKNTPEKGVLRNSLIQNKMMTTSDSTVSLDMIDMNFSNKNGSCKNKDLVRRKILGEKAGLPQCKSQINIKENIRKSSGVKK